jgi:hypothetical protein
MDTDKNKEKWMPASTMLDDMDIRYDRRGKRRIFSVKFVTLSGKLHYFPQCYAQGAGKMNNKEYRMRGLQPCGLQRLSGSSCFRSEDHEYTRIQWI